MTLDDTLTAIDAATAACEQCGEPRDCSPSDYFCSEPCQRRWLSAQTLDLPEIGPTGEGTVTLEITIDTSGFDAAWSRMQDALWRMQWARAAMHREGPDPRRFIFIAGGSV